MLKKYSGKNHPNWKGDDVSYNGLHKWLHNNYGKSNKCEKCGKDNLIGHQIHWAKIKGKKHERKRENYWRLCAKCHSFYDEIYKLKPNLGKHWKVKDTSNMKGSIPWNKGLLGFQKGHKPYNINPNSGSFKKGIHYSLNTEFKKGIIPANKGKKFIDGHYYFI